MKGFTAERTNKAETRPEEQSENKVKNHMLPIGTKEGIEHELPIA